MAKKPNPPSVYDEILEVLRAIERHLQRQDDALLILSTNEKQILALLEELIGQTQVPLPSALQIFQSGDTMITGIPVGGKGTFVESFVPSNAALPAGAVLTVTWTADDPKVTLTPSADGTSVDAVVDPSDTATSFNLTATGTSAALPGPITSGPVEIPILPAPPPLPTALAINQTA